MPNVNNLPRHSKTAEQIVRERGISLNNFAIRRQYTVCPKCSSDRKKKTAECLAVTIETDRVYWACNHCGDKGCEYYEQKQAVKKNGGAEIHYAYTATLRKVRTAQKKFFWQHLEAGEWKSGTGGANTRDLLYRYDELKAAIDQAQPVAVAEGEKDVDNLWKTGIPATTNAHGAGKWSSSLTEKLKDASAIVVFADNDVAGIDHAAKILNSLWSKKIKARLVDLTGHWETIPESGDISDYIASGRDAKALFDQELLKATDSAKPNSASPKPNSSSGNGHTTLSDDEVEAMAAMGAIELAQTIQKLAADKDVPQAAVKSEFKSKSLELGLSNGNSRIQGSRIQLEEPEMYQGDINHAETLDAVCTEAYRYLKLPDHAAEKITAWIAHSYMPRCYDIAPRLQIFGPDKKCGKTTLLDFLSMLVYRPVMCGNITPAGFFRMVEMNRPTMLIDEVDSFAAQNWDIRNVLNNGHHVQGFVIRCVGDDLEPRQFSCFAPLAYAHIGELDKIFNPLLDRSIPIHLARLAADEKIDQLSEVRKTNSFKLLRQKLKRLALDLEHAIADANPVLDEINDYRMQDNWRPLIAIGQLAGGDWEQRLRAAAFAHTTLLEETLSTGEQLLTDIKSIFEKLKDSFIYSAFLADQLADMEDRPYSEWGTPPKRITARAIATVLHNFGIKPVYDDRRTGRGYARKQFEDAWHRYTPYRPAHA